MEDYMFKANVEGCKSVRESTTYLEIHSYSDTSFNTVEEHTLLDDEFDCYLQQKGPFLPKKLPEGVTRLSSMRLILHINAKDPEAFFPQNISFTAEQYESMVRVMHLPLHVIESTSCVGPFFWAAWKPDEDKRHLQTIMRKSDFSKKGRTRGWEVALSYDMNNATTTGYCKGAPSSDMFECIKHLKACAGQILHPLLLPTIIYSYKISFRNDVKQRKAREWLRQIECALSMRFEMDNNYVDRRGTIEFDALTQDITECHTHVISKRPKAYLEILAGLEGSFHQFWESLPEERQTKDLKQLHGSMLTRLAFHKVRLQSIDCYADTTLQRLDVQRAALYNMMAHKESKLSFQMAREQRKLAYASKRDSAAMKSISLLGAIFLPGAYLAAVFSMTFFNWQPDPGQSMLSKSFWIYWAFTIPITFGVVGGWLWYERKQDHIERSENEKDEKFEKQMETDIINKMRRRRMMPSKVQAWNIHPNIEKPNNRAGARELGGLVQRIFGHKHGSAMV